MGFDLGSIGAMVGADLYNNYNAQQFAQDQQGDAQEFAGGQSQVTRDFNSAEAVRNRDFEERMSNTSWQRGTADMMAAGINPMLAFNKGGASTPGGSAASSSPAGAGIASPSHGTPPSTAMAALAHIDVQKAQAENIRADTSLKEADLPVHHGALGVQNQVMAKMRAEIEEIGTREDLNREHKNLIIEEIKNAIEENRRIKADTGIKIVDEVLRRLEIPLARNLAAAEDSGWKKYVSPFLGDVGKTVGSAAGIRQAIRPGGNVTINRPAFGSSGSRGTITAPPERFKPIGPMHYPKSGGMDSPSRSYRKPR